MEGEGWGSGGLPAESFFTHGSFFYGNRTYTTRQQQVWTHILPPSHGVCRLKTVPLSYSRFSNDKLHGTEGVLPTRHPDPDEAVEVGFQGPVSVAAAYGSHDPRLQQRKRGRVSEAAVLRLLHEVEAASTPGTDDCCVICLEDFTAAPALLTLRAMPGCSHAFHQHCILQWLRVKVACPVCRHQLPPFPFHRGRRRPRGEDQEEHRRRSVYDDWLSFRGSRPQSPVTREDSS